MRKVSAASSGDVAPTLGSDDFYGLLSELKKQRKPQGRRVSAADDGSVIVVERKIWVRTFQASEGSQVGEKRVADQINAAGLEEASSPFDPGNIVRVPYELIVRGLG